MELDVLLYRWSTTVQVVSVVMIAGFFLVLSRTVRRAEVRPVAWAWLANAAALGVTVVFWFARPEGPAATVPLEIGYYFFKSLFVALLVLAGWRFAHPGAPSPIRVRTVLLGVAAWACLAATSLDGTTAMGTFQSGVMALGWGLGLWALAGASVDGLTGLRIGFAARGVLAVLESLAYGSGLLGLEAGRHPMVQTFVAGHSSIDTGAEWLIALGFVLALSATIQRELVATNQDLLRTQHELQGLVDRDPLTGLANRRAIPAILRSVYRTGATILFFDLDDFKEVNDAHGHPAGDEVLMRFARALREAFRPDDRVVRYAGDEFVVVAPGSEPRQILPRLDVLRAGLADQEGIPVGFTAGHARLEPGGDAEAALRAADAAMYALKATRGRGGPSLPAPMAAEA